MLTLAYLEDLKVQRRRYMAKRSRATLRKGTLLEGVEWECENRRSRAVDWIGTKSMLILPAKNLDEDLLNLYWANRTNTYSEQLTEQLSKYGLAPTTPSGLQMAVQLCKQAPSEDILKLFADVTTPTSKPARPAWIEQISPGDNILTPWNPKWAPPSTIRSRINIITGKGINSKDGPVIRPMVFRLLTR